MKLRKSALVLTTIGTLAVTACGGDDGLSRASTTDATSTTADDISSTPRDSTPATPTTVAVTTTRPNTTTAVSTPSTTAAPTTTTLPPTTTVPSGVMKVEEWLLQERETWNWGAIIEVTGDQAREIVDVEARFYDEADRLIDTQTAYLSVALPGRTAVTGTLFQPAAVPVRMDIAVDEGSRSSRSGPYGALNLSNITIVPDRFSTEVVGEIQSTFEQEQEFVQLTAIWRDPATGGVSYVETGYVDAVPAQGTTLFSISLCCGDGLPVDPPAEVHWSL